ncbi:MAG: ABC transporter substrate-binding protein [Thermotogota bacterium]
MKKVLLFLIAITIFLAGFSYVISVPVGPTSLPAYYLEENSEIEIETIIHKNRNVLISNLMQGKADMALMPTNEAVKLYNRGVDIKVINIHTWGVFYMVTTNPDIKEWEDLDGKEIYVPDKGGPMDILFNYMTDSKDINNFIVKRGKPNQITQMMINDLAETAFLRETFVTQILVNNEKSRIFKDIQKNWEEITAIELPQASFVVRNEVLEENSKFKLFLNSEYQKAIDWMYGNPEEAAVLAKNKMKIPPKVTIASMDRLNMKIDDSSEIKGTIYKYLELLKEYNEDSIGGKLPDENFFY